jgi:hypothetical protein
MGIGLDFGVRRRVGVPFRRCGCGEWIRNLSLWASRHLDKMLERKHDFRGTRHTHEDNVKPFRSPLESLQGY